VLSGGKPNRGAQRRASQHAAELEAAMAVLNSSEKRSFTDSSIKKLGLFAAEVGERL
jgi:hypothetical protein